MLATTIFFFSHNVLYSFETDLRKFRRLQILCFGLIKNIFILYKVNILFCLVFVILQGDKIRVVKFESIYMHPLKNQLKW